MCFFYNKRRLKKHHYVFMCVCVCVCVCLFKWNSWVCAYIYMCVCVSEILGVSVLCLCVRECVYVCVWMIFYCIFVCVCVDSLGKLDVMRIQISYFILVLNTTNKKSKGDIIGYACYIANVFH